MLFIKSINVNFNGYLVPLQSVLISDTTSTSTDELKPLHRECVGYLVGVYETGETLDNAGLEGGGPDLWCCLLQGYG